MRSKQFCSVWSKAKELFSEVRLGARLRCNEWAMLSGHLSTSGSRDKVSDSQEGVMWPVFSCSFLYCEPFLQLMSSGLPEQWVQLPVETISGYLWHCYYLCCLGSVGASLDHTHESIARLSRALWASGLTQAVVGQHITEIFTGSFTIERQNDDWWDIYTFFQPLIYSFPRIRGLSSMRYCILALTPASLCSSSTLEGFWSVGLASQRWAFVWGRWVPIVTWKFSFLWNITEVTRDLYDE